MLRGGEVLERVGTVLGGGMVLERVGAIETYHGSSQWVVI